MSEAEHKKTPLCDENMRLGAKMVPFGGWLMPVQYTSIIEEHLAVRNNVGVFDISHMGQLVATGPGAGAWLNEMLTNNIDKLEVGTGQYTFLLNDGGGIIDDLIVYRTAPGLHCHPRPYSNSGDVHCPRLCPGLYRSALSFRA